MSVCFELYPRGCSAESCEIQPVGGGVGGEWSVVPLTPCACPWQRDHSCSGINQDYLLSSDVFTPVQSLKPVKLETNPGTDFWKLFLLLGIV